MYIQFKNVNKVKLFSDDSQLFLNFISTKVLSILLFTTSTYPNTAKVQTWQIKPLEHIWKLQMFGQLFFGTKVLSLG